MHVTYSWQTLFQLLSVRTSCLDLDIPPLLQIKSQRKRGSRGGIWVRNRKPQFKLVLPLVILGNVCSRWRSCQPTQNMIVSIAMLYFTETCLTDNFLFICVNGWLYSLRHDRGAAKMEKKSGEVCLYVNNLWCHTKVKTTLSTPDIELLVVCSQLYYLPSEESLVIVLVV